MCKLRPARGDNNSSYESDNRINLVNYIFAIILHQNTKVKFYFEFYQPKTFMCLCMFFNLTDF